MANYSWSGQTPLVTKGNPVYGKSDFGQDIHNGNRMQPAAYYEQTFLERKRFKGDDLVFANYATRRSIKKGLTEITLRGYKPLKAHIVPLVEGLPPAADKAGGKAISAKTRQYGRYMEFTDLFEVKIMDNVIEEYSMELADLANETIDMLAQAALLAEAQVFYPVASKAGNKQDLADQALKAGSGEKEKAKPTFQDLRIIGLTMDAAKVKPINGTFKVLVSPAVFFDLQTDETVTDFMRYGQTNAQMSNNSLPEIYGLSVVKAQSAKVESITGTASGTTFIHHSIVLGAKAYSRVEIAGNGGVQFFMKELGSAGTLDPLNQRRTMGWKINALGFKVEDPDAVVDYMSVPSQAPIITDNFDYVSDLPAEIGITDEMAKVLQKIDKSIGTGNTPAASITATTASNLDADEQAKITTLDAKTVGQFADAKDPKVPVGQTANPLNAKEKAVVKHSV